MRSRLLSLLLAVILIVLSGCSSGNLSLTETAITDTTEESVRVYNGPVPSVFVYNPDGTWDTVDPALRNFLREAREQYVPGDTSFTIQNDSELGSRFNPVVFSFEIENEKEFSDPYLEISESEDFPDCLSVKVGRGNKSGDGYSVPVNNLKSGATYYWRVSMTAKGGFKVDSEPSSFTTMPGPRILRIDGVTNARDLGGWETADGKTVRQGMVYRTALLDNATAEGKKTIRGELKITTELDLRNPNSSSDTINSPFTNSLNYINISAPSYSVLDDEYTSKDAKIFRVFAKPSNYPVAMHCTGGADRTGVFSFLLKALCGVDEIDLICDYELTPNRFRTGYISGEHNFNFPKFYESFLRLPGDTTWEKAYYFVREKCHLSEMEIANIVSMLTSDGGVYTDPASEPITVKNGELQVQLLPRSSEGVKAVFTDDGAEMDFSFEKNVLTVKPVSGRAGSGRIIFSDGSELPLIWAA
ncbi:MAG: tyrosine-protein phosphatase [Clostridia bacterium]|nr:tyrosine-protein phosphatase [Clostridia bacterium]